MSLSQAAILAPVPQVGRYLFFSLVATDAARDSLTRLATLADGEQVLVGLGPELVHALGAAVPGLHPFEPLSNLGVRVPSTPAGFVVRRSMPVTGAFFWCPPMREGHLDLRGIGL